MDLLYECRQYGNRGLNTGTDSITIIIIVTFKCNIRHAESLKTFIKVKNRKCGQVTYGITVH